MKKPSIWLIPALLLFVILHSYGQHQKAGTVRVKLKEAYESKISKSTAQTAQFGLPEIDEVSTQLNVRSLRRVFRQSGKFEKAHRAFGLHLWYEISFDTSIQVSDAIKAYGKLEAFESVEPATSYRLIDPIKSEKKISGSRLTMTSTNDPLFGQQWHYKNVGQSGGTSGADISLEQAWAMETGTPSVIVAIIDGGIDIQHPDLVNALWTNEGEIAGNNIDDDGNGYVDDVHGYGFGDGTGTIYPDYHGTHVAGTVGASSNNSLGVAGVAGGDGTNAGVRLMSCATFGEYSTGGFEDAMVYAADNGAVISQNSWGGGSQAIEEAIDYFIARAGLDNSDENFADNVQTGPMAGGIVIFAAGNSNTSDPTWGYPASYPPVMAVASTDHSDYKSNFSNFGQWVDIAAPGTDILSSSPFSSYEFLSGTSMACPHVSGVAALIVSKFGRDNYTPTNVWDRLQLSADNIDLTNEFYIGLLGSGRLNASMALQEEDSIPPGSITDLAISEVGYKTLTLTWTAPGATGNEGTASKYDLRSSNSPITNENFNSATQLNIKKPNAAGQTEHIVIENLTDSLTYYFAVKTIDFSGNVSGISNTLQVAMPGPPIISVTPVLLEETLTTGETSIRYLEILNTGESNLTLSATSSASPTPEQTAIPFRRQITYSKGSDRQPRRTEKPSLSRSGRKPVEPLSIQTTSSADSLNKGRLFLANYYDQSIQEVRPGTGEVITSLPLPDYLDYNNGLTFDGRYLYFSDDSWPVKVYQLDATSGDVVSVVEILNVYDISALAHSGTHLYALDGTSNEIHEIDYVKGEITHTLEPDIWANGGLSFGGSRNTLFLNDYNSGYTYEINSNTGEVVSSIYTGYNILGLAYSNSLSALFVADAMQEEIRAYNPDTGEHLYTIPSLFATALSSDEATGFWMNLENEELTVAPGNSFSLPVHLNCERLLSGQYSGTINIQSNDPLSPLTNVDVSLTVIGIPDIFIPDSLETGLQFDSVYKDNSTTQYLYTRNVGTENLSVSVTSNAAAFNVPDSTFTLYPEHSIAIPVTFTPSDTVAYNGILTITSNDPDEQAIEIAVSGTGRTYLFELNPGDVYVSVPPDSVVNTSLALSNITLTSSDWDVELQSMDNTLETQLSALNKLHTNITSLIPQPFNFEEGESGYSIINGGNNMYNDGNYLSANYYYSLPYSNNTIVESSALGTNGSYFTAKYPGLFVFAANIAIERFQISGYLGNGNYYAPIDATVLSLTKNSVKYKGFVKRVYNTPEPSVNHLIIIEDNGNAQQTYGYSGYDDYHSVYNLSGVSQLHYLLFANADGGYTSNEVMLTIMEAYIDAIQNPTWLIISPDNGELSSGSSTQLLASFDSEGLSPGKGYQAEIIVNSSRTGYEAVRVPVKMKVEGTPDIVFENQTIPFGNVYANESKDQSILVSNTGNDTLKLSLNSFLDVFSVSNTVQLAAGETKEITIRFSPTAVQQYDGHITITTNDLDEPQFTVNLSGVGIEDILSVTPNPIQLSIPMRMTENHTFELSNTSDTYTFDWSLVVTSPETSSLEAQLRMLDSLHTNVTNLIPNLFHFSEGEDGYSISDGGYDMYDGGNYIVTDLLSYIPYSNKQVVDSYAFGPTGKYFTAKYPGLFVLAADCDIESFAIWGNLGADGSGYVSADIISTTFNNKQFTGYVKRVYDSWDASVNHLIIVEHNQDISHGYSTYTGDDFHQIAGLSGLQRLNYLLFSSSTGEFIDNATMLEIMKAYLSSTSGKPQWLTLSPTTGAAAPGESVQINAKIDASTLLPGQYRAKILANTLLDDYRTLEIPVELTVEGTAILNIADTSVNCNYTFVDSVSLRSFDILNTGYEPLIIDQITSGNSEFTITPQQVIINPNDTATIEVAYKPSATGKDVTTLHVYSNDLVSPVTTLTASGEGVVQGKLVVTSDVSTVSVDRNVTTSFMVQLKNTGKDTISWFADQLPNWASPAVTSGTLQPNGVQFIQIFIYGYELNSSDYLQLVYHYGASFEQLSYFNMKVDFISNKRPILVKPIPNQVLVASDWSSYIYLYQYFQDPNYEALSFSADVNGDYFALTAYTDDYFLVLDPSAVGEADITVTATDGLDSISTTFNVKVKSSRLPPILELSADKDEYRVNKTGTTTATITLQNTGDQTAYWNLQSLPEWITCDSLTTTGILAYEETQTVQLSIAGLTIPAGSYIVPISFFYNNMNDPIETISLLITVRENQKPTLVHAFNNVSLKEGAATNVIVPGHFSDADGDQLSYAAFSTDSTLVRATLQGDTLVIVANQSGQSEVIITANDGFESTQTSMLVSVRNTENHAPTLTKDIADKVLDVETGQTLTLSNHFTDSDGDSLVFSSSSSDLSVLITSINNHGEIELKPKAVGKSEVTITAADFYGGTAEVKFFVVVIPILGTEQGQNHLIKLYPNPIKEKTTIQYFLTEESNVQFVVKDLSGRTLNQLSNQTQSPGLKEATYDGSNLSSGLYLYYLFVNNKLAGHGKLMKLD